MLVGWTEEGRAWLASLPPAVRDTAAEHPPWHTYVVRGMGLRAEIDSYNDEGERGVSVNALVVHLSIPEHLRKLRTSRMTRIPVSELRRLHPPIKPTP